MRRILAWIGGILSGAAVGTAVALLFTPESGDSARQRLRDHYQAARLAGQEAAVRRQEELRQRLIEITGPHPPDSPMLQPPPSQSAERKLRP